MKLVPFVVAAAGIAGLLLACSDETIVLATVPNEDDGGSVPPSMDLRGCAKAEDCPTGTFCDRGHHCASLTGTCVHFPTFCPEIEEPSCGCDGVTYFNDCLRQAAGISGSDNGECLHRAATCDTSGDGCLPGQSCGQLGGFGDPTTCKSFGGRCWVLPSRCPTDGLGDDRWDECSADPGALRCTDTCTAIRSGKVFDRAARCQ